MDIVQNILSATTLTLTELERKCGFPKSSIRKWSENIPNINKVARVAEVLGVSLDRLYYGDTITSESPPNVYAENPTEERLLVAFRSLTPEDRFIEIGRIEHIVEGYPDKSEDTASGNTNGAVSA